MFLSQSSVIDLVITGGWDKKIRFWDTRSPESLGCLDNLSVEVESMSLSGFHLMVAVGSSVSTYDLRNFNKLVQPKESFMDLRIKCVRAILVSEGTVKGFFNNHLIHLIKLACTCYYLCNYW